MKKFIFIAGISRSGGSLMCRMFDGHKDVASYPVESGFKFKKNIYSFVDEITGSPSYLPNFSKDLNLIDFFEAKKIEPIYKWGNEKSEKLGVRKNYIEKSYYEKNIKTDFNYDNYVAKLNFYCKKAQNNHELYTGKHRAYFESWDDGKNIKNPNFVVFHSSSGLFLNNFDKYFNDFPDSIIITPIRDALGYVASEKVRIARRYFGSRRFSKPIIPNFLVKHFDQYDINALLRTWNTSITRIRILQEKFDFNKRFIVYRFENLVKDPKKILDFICSRVDLDNDPVLYQPTLKGRPWLGNSHQGEIKGINNDPNKYIKEILHKDEIKLIEQNTKQLNDEIKNIDTPCLDLKKISNNHFFDYENQKKYSQDNDIWSLYCAFAFSGFRKLKLTSVSFIIIFALFYKMIVRIYHIPRLIKQRYLKGLGKQNYT